MKRRTYLLVFRENDQTKIDLPKELESAIEFGDVLFRFDYNVAFVQSKQNVQALTERLRKTQLGDAYFFLADVTDTSRAGNMVPSFWDMIRDPSKLVAAS